MQIGGVRARRLERDLGITTVAEVAEADVETLTEVWSVGEHTAKRMKGSAQGLMNELEAERESESTRTNELRVAVVAGNDVLDDLDAEVSHAMIEDALVDAGVELDSKTRIGFVTDGMGGEVVTKWLDHEVMFGETNPREQPFQTPWTKYAKITDPERFENTVVEDGETRVARADRPSLKTDIPFDVHRYQDVDIGMAPRERTRNMVRWADQVVIVADGDYAESFWYECKKQGKEDECHVPDGVDYEGPDAPDVNEPDAEERKANSWTDEADLHQDDLWRERPNDTDEARRINDLEHSDPGGRGVGSNMDRWN